MSLFPTWPKATSENNSAPATAQTNFFIFHCARIIVALRASIVQRPDPPTSKMPQTTMLGAAPATALIQNRDGKTAAAGHNRPALSCNQSKSSRRIDFRLHAKRGNPQMAIPPRNLRPQRSLRKPARCAIASNPWLVAKTSRAQTQGRSAESGTSAERGGLQDRRQGPALALRETVERSE